MEMEYPEQEALFDLDEFASWRREWVGMPDFIQEDLEPAISIIVHFETWEHVKDFARLLDQPISIKTKSLWYPKAEILSRQDKRYADEP